MTGKSKQMNTEQKVSAGWKILKQNVFMLEADTSQCALCCTSSTSWETCIPVYHRHATDISSLEHAFLPITDIPVIHPGHETDISHDLNLHSCLSHTFLSSTQDLRPTYHDLNMHSCLSQTFLSSTQDMKHTYHDLNMHSCLSHTFLSSTQDMRPTYHDLNLHSCLSHTFLSSIQDIRPTYDLNMHSCLAYHRHSYHPSRTSDPHIMTWTCIPVHHRHFCHPSRTSDRPIMIWVFSPASPLEFVTYIHHGHSLFLDMWHPWRLPHTHIINTPCHF